MSQEKSDNVELLYSNQDRVATQKDLRILSLELEQKIQNIKIELLERINHLELSLFKMESRLFKKLGSLIVASSGIVFGLLMHFHK